jgi:2-polyprenyl-3-methyl-5-hydroxy-6-metoxy-1,4-benzoquinol methylase
MIVDDLGKKYDRIAQRLHNEEKMGKDYKIKHYQRAIQYCKYRRNALDVGCGSGGQALRTIIESGFAIKAIDISENMLEIARSAHPEVSFELCDIRTWESSDKYDLIVAWDSIFHISSKLQESVISKLCNHLQPSGILVYTFGDAIGDMESYSFSEKDGTQFAEVKGISFPYGTIGIEGNLHAIEKNHCQCRHLELDQGNTGGHVYIIAQNQSEIKNN